MTRTRRLVTATALIAAGFAFVTPTTTGTAAAASTFTPCAATAPAGRAHCLTIIENTASSHPRGLGATALRAAYEVPKPKRHTLVAVSIWHNAAHLEHDLNTYRRQYGLGPCTTASGCLRIVNQQGEAAPLPEDDAYTGVEETLDVSMISAACPTCHILVVESTTNRSGSLAAGERTAVRLGATVVSNSYGITESGTHPQYRSAYQHAGVVTVASTGDAGYSDTESPAAYPGVVAVGGTELTKSPSTKRGWREQAWTYGSSGCSAYSRKPAWQHDTLCPHRLTSDISGAADDIALYDTDVGGWTTIGGTSASAPFVAGLFGLAGNAETMTPKDLYAHAKDFHDVTSGTDDPVENGRACEHTALCVAEPGYDGPTGLGTPHGIRGL